MFVKLAPFSHLSCSPYSTVTVDLVMNYILSNRDHGSLQISKTFLFSKRGKRLFQIMTPGFPIIIGFGIDFNPHQLRERASLSKVLSTAASSTSHGIIESSSTMTLILMCCRSAALRMD